MPDVVTIVFIFIAGAGWLLLQKGWHGRAVDNHPACRRCRFDLHTVWPGAEKCPECGANLSAAGSVEIGRRARRYSLIAYGLAILFLCSIWFSPWARTSMRRVNWPQYKPDWLLVHEAHSSDSKRVEAALTSIVSRVKKDEFSDSRLAKLAAYALDLQSDVNADWSDLWGEIVEIAWQDNLLTAEQIHDYAEQACSFTLVVNSPFVRQWEVAELGSQVRNIRGGQGGLSIAAEPVKATLNGSDLPIKADGTGRARNVRLGAASVANLSFPVIASPGGHEIDTQWRVTVSPAGSTTPAATLDVRLSTPITVLAPSPESPELVVDPAIDAAMRQCITIRAIGLRVAPESGPEASRTEIFVEVDIDQAPIAADMHIKVLTGGGPLRDRSTSVLVDTGASRQVRLRLPRVALELGMVNVVIEPQTRPDRVIFGQHTGSPDAKFDRMWYGRTLEFSDVAVRWFDTEDDPAIPEGLRELLPGHGPDQ